MNDNQNPSSDQPLVTHADRRDLLDLRATVEDFDSDEAARKVALLDRLISAAEADKPALPEGWVLIRDRVVHWHQDGCLYNNPISRFMTYNEVDVRDLIKKDALIPLATAASLVPENMRVDERGYIVYKTGGTVSTADLKAVVTDLLNAAEAERGESR